MYPVIVNRKLPELIELELLLQECSQWARIEVLDHIEYDELELPIHKVVFGSKDPEAPTLALFGGVHGLERIGSQVVLAIMKSVVELLRWDEMLRRTLEDVRLVFMPIVNPVGMLNQTRSNGNGVDLMRNAPVDAGGEASFMVGGQRISQRLPWFRGNLGQAMEKENQALVRLVHEELFASKAALSLDLHSGFGVQDQIWFPYAKTTKAFPDIAELYALKELLDKTYPNHFYKVEPQAKFYTTHGDIWDFLYDEHRAQSKGAKYLPLTLEMGSWLWVKKNPRQFFSALGPFNPIMPHRRRRILRRHNTLFEFLLRSVLAHKEWASLKPDQRMICEQKAKALWNGK